MGSIGIPKRCNKLITTTPKLGDSLIQPDKGLQERIYYYWKLDIEVPRIDLEVIPDIAMDLVMSPDIPDFSILYFPAAEKFTIPLEGPISYLGVCCKIRASENLFGRPLSTLKTLAVGTETSASLGVTSLVNAIQGMTDPERIKSLFDAHFLNQASAIVNDHDTPGSVFDALFESLAPERIESVARHIGLSERQFRRVTTNLFGFSPKKIQRIMKLQLALRELFDDRSAISQVDYYDESHRIRELKKLTGLTPGEIRRMAENYNP